MKFELNDALSDGLGDDENEFHNDKNITFIMLMTQGSVTRYELYNTSSGVEELLQTFKVENKLHPTVGEFYYYFSENQELNITFKAFNTYEESDSVEASIWIKDPVTEIEGIMIVEGEDVTSRGEDKPINITFNCASTHSLCLVIDYGDGAPLAAYGDEGICMANFSEAKFQPNDLTMPMIVEHTYWVDGKYNLTAILFNPVSFGKASLTFLVVPFSCKKPIITVNGASLVKETANGYFRSNPIVADTETYIPNCEVPFTSIERWMVSKIDPLTGETIEPIVIQNILPSWNKSSLLIKKNFLDFGLYKLDYSKQLYEGDEPPNIPYEVMTTSYVVVIRSPLVAIMVPGSVSRLVRGWGQQASLDPGSNSIDPDLPEDKSFECEWYCRQLTEEFPMNGTVMLDKPLLPVRNVGDPVPSGRSGCFGSGPGRLDFNSCKWDIDTNIFHPAGEDITFHLVVVIKKNGRRAESFIDLEMVSGKPPMMTIKCVSPKLCSPTEGGVFINPENRLGLIGNCTFDCYPPLTYEWTVSMVSNNSVDPIPIDDVDKYIMSEPNTKYLSLSKTIYSNYSTIQKFHVSLKSNNSHPSQKTGAATFYVIRNKPPNVRDAMCKTNLTCHKALICEMIIECQLPTDPEGHDIGEYSFMTKTTSPDTIDNPVWKTVAKVPKPSITLRFPYGNVTVYYKVSDALGSTSMKKVTTINSQMPSKQEYDEFMDGPFTIAVTLKQTLKVANIMQVAESIRKRAPWNAPGYVEEGVDPTDAAAAVSAQNAKAVNGISNMAMNSPAALEMASSSMDSIISSAYGSPESSMNLDSDTASASVQVADAMLNGAEDADLSTPEDMAGAFTAINTVIGASTVTAALIAEDTECKAVPPADLKKSPKMEYDPRITDYSKPVDNTDILKQQACNVRDHSMGASEENAKKFDRMGEKMKFLALQKMVLGETQEIRSASGVVMKNQIMKNTTAAVLGIGDSGSNVQTGENFCPTGNCDDPVGTSMAEYPKNTKSGAAGADALGKDTKVVSMEVTLGDGSENVAVANLSEPLVITIKKPAMNMSIGDKDETCPRTFGKPKRKFFRKGGQDAFVMACPRPLGDLLHLRVWHDNSGVGRYSSWYLQYIHIRDVQTGKHYDFVADRWLAVEENDGKIDALIPVAGKEQLGQFSHVFSHTSQQNLSDGHLWFSVFLRPPRSRFTRVQRVSSCFALLFLSMMVNAMWYGVVPSTPSSGALNFGPMSLSIEQISVGVMSNLIIFPPSFLIVFLFKKSRARKLRKSRIDEALEKQKFGNQVAKSERPASVASHGEKSDEGNDKKKKKKKKPLLLPWWCRIIAWILCIICLFGSAFIVWAYGVQFGNEKTTKWLTSLLTSFFSSILLIQPIKVFLIAMVVSSIFKSVDLESDDADEDELYNSQVNLFGIATIFAEAVPGGGFLPGWRFDGVRLIRHHAGFQTFVFICEITYMFFIIYFMVREIRDMIKQKKDYFKSYWVYSEIAIILLSWAAFIVYILRYIETDAVLKIFKDTYGNGYVKMQYAQTLDDVFGYLLGMLVFIATIKFSKLLRFNRRIGMLSATLKQCWGDLTGFFLIFFIALGTFAMVFHLLLLTHMDDFKNIMSATESAFAMMLNKFDFESMRAASLLAVVLFLMFAITMSIFFVNVLLTIIIRAFQQVKDDVLKQPNDFEILEFVQMRMFRFIGLGQHRVQPLREHVKQFQEEQQRKDKQQKQIDQLPSKMDQFLSQVNDMYFDGQLDLNNKEFLKKTLASKKNK
ncbi:Polycystic kidney disease protein 1-like 2 [Amphibalanus amphitrite]|uniref:Polycystic kidney disease protein 1-like 2 n=1 Tax=Amphibalanus amphitrite TaxID=1232801 RepID=A0A6A4W0T1_AMPAM|nr:Polycystic kidney disease protein 1-like 2 [Amphibalanus amphitrite]